MQQRLQCSLKVKSDIMKDILSYHELAMREGFGVQRGMNYKPQNKRYSVLLMSLRENSPYNDGFDEKGEKLHYEGEDVSSREAKYPKEVDQVIFTKTGKLTGNGKFFKAAEDYNLGRIKKPDIARIYEKIDSNVWSDKGLFDLVDAEFIFSKEEKRKVFKFIFVPSGTQHDMRNDEIEEFEFSRRIPTSVKRVVWERDDAKCVKCGATDDLHFDHDIPFSKGGSSTDPKNIKLLCSKCNLKKSDKIE